MRDLPPGSPVTAARPLPSAVTPGLWCVFVNQDGEYGVGTLQHPPTGTYGDRWVLVKSGLDSQSQADRVAARMGTYDETELQES